MDSPKPKAPRRPKYAYVKIGKTVIHAKIDWDEYEKEKAKKGKKGKAPDVFTVHGYNSTWRVRRERLTFDHRYTEEVPNA